MTDEYTPKPLTAVLIDTTLKALVLVAGTALLVPAVRHGFAPHVRAAAGPAYPVVEPLATGLYALTAFGMVYYLKRTYWDYT